jgi:hypothetical protein
LKNFYGVGGKKFNILRRRAARAAVLFLLAAGVFCLPLADDAAWGVDLSNSDTIYTLTNYINNGYTIYFPYNVNAINIGITTLTLQGVVPPGFTRSAATSAESIISNADGQKNLATSYLATWLQGQVNPSAFISPNLTTISGNGLIRLVTSSNPSSLNQNKWLRFSNSNSILNLKNLHFADLISEYNYDAAGAGGVVNALIGNDNSVSGNIAMGNITDNAFTAINVTMNGSSDKNYLAGSGIIGLRSTGASASINEITGNLFKNVSVSATDAYASNGSAYIEGGGIIGVDSVSSPGPDVGSATIANLSNNLFTDVHIDTGDIILGGGLVGLNNNSRAQDITTYAKLTNASGNIFGNGDAEDITVKTGYSLRGGGVIGLNGLSNAAVELDYLTKNIFAGINIDAGTYLRGGGVVGLQNSDQEPKETYGTIPTSDITAFLGDATGNLFLNIKVNSGTEKNNSIDREGGNIDGGGIIGVRSNYGMAGMGVLSGNIFKGLDVVTSGDIIASDTKQRGDLIGGGVVGLSSATRSALTVAERNYFDDIRVNVAGELRGGGIIGANAEDGSYALPANGSVFGSLNNNIFNNLHVDVTGDITGGGIIGAHTEEGVAGIGWIYDNIFNSLTTVSSNGRLYGGGVVGLDAADLDQEDAYIEAMADNKFYGVGVDVAGEIEGGGVIGLRTDVGGAYINSMSGNVFTGANIRTGEYIEGGGVLGLRASDGFAGIVSLTDNVFDGATVLTDTYIFGGGVVGVRANGIAYIRETARNRFTNSSITAGTYIDGGGILGVTGDTFSGTQTGIWLIDSSVFSGNNVAANNGQIMGGLVYSYGLAGDGMTIRDSSFTGNTFSSTITDDQAYNLASQSFALPKVYGTVTVDTGNPLAGGAPHTLTLTSTSGHSTIFRNNQIVEGPDSRYNSIYFGSVDGWAMDSSDLISRDIDPSRANAALIIDAKAKGTVALYDPIVVSQDAGYTFNMNVKGNGGDFIWGGANEFSTDNNQPGNVTLEAGSKTTLLGGFRTKPTDHETFGLEAANFNFNLAQGGKLTAMGSNVMTLASANLLGNLNFNLDGTEWQDSSLLIHDPILTIDSPTNTNIEGSIVSLMDFSNGPSLQAGNNVFPLIATAANNAGRLDGNPANNMAYARQGLLRGYNFTVDKAGPLNYTSNQYLFAYFHSAQAAHEARSLSEGRAASLGFLTASWLPDHSYQQADLALYLAEDEKSWAPFAGIDGAWGKYDTGNNGKFDLSGTRMVLGIARKDRKPDKSLLLGLFAEAGYGSYDTYNEFERAPNPGMIGIYGDGTLRYLGGGIMARREWSNGVRLEGSLRAGHIKNKFYAPDYIDPGTGIAAGYEFYAPYYAAHVGLARTWQLSGNKQFDLLGRYYWTRQGSKHATLSNGEEVDFDDDDSHRVRLGGRLTFVRDERRSWYLGAAGEYELDGDVNARAYGHSFGVPSLGGFTGIGEIGLIYRASKDDPFSLEAGIQGYIGQFRGLSGGIRMEWEF